MKSSQQLFEQAQRFIPGGVNSPVRAFKGVGGTPLFFDRAKGAFLYDVDGRRYVDYVGSWGPMILGHAHPQVTAAVEAATKKGLSFGAPTEIEVQMARVLCERVPSLEMVRMVNSGTEATMSALRLARGYTGRDKIVKFEGCYHGHADALLVKAGSGALTCGVPSSPGVPAATTEHTLTLPYNDTKAVHELFSQMGREIACVIVEPVAGNMNCVLPEPGFLDTLRQVCDRYRSLLIFDEVMTGFRVALGGAQAFYGITPDLTCLGKVIGGGLPVGAFGGRREIMEQLAPVGPVYQAGTLSGNPVALAAGLKTLEIVSEPGFYDCLDEKTRQLTQGLSERATCCDLPVRTNQIGGMFGIFFTQVERVTHFAQVTACDQEAYKRFFHGMLEEGIYMAPSPFEAGFVSIAHDDDALTATLAAAERVFRDLKS